MGTLSAAQRHALPKKDFVEPGKEAYPIQDEAHARSALARVAANGSPGLQARVLAAVRKKYPGMKVAGKGGK